MSLKTWIKKSPELWQGPCGFVIAKGESEIFEGNCFFVLMGGKSIQSCTSLGSAKEHVETFIHECATFYRRHKRRPR